MSCFDPSQTATLEIGPNSDRVLRILARRVTVKPNNSESMLAGLVDRDRRHCPGAVELRQMAHQVRSDCLDRPEEAQTQISHVHVDE